MTILFNLFNMKWWTNNIVNISNCNNCSKLLFLSTNLPYIMLSIYLIRAVLRRICFSFLRMEDVVLLFLRND